MKRTLLAIVVTVSALAPRSASAQVSIWLQRGVSGFGGAASVTTSSDVTMFGVSGGYSYQGVLDFDLNLNYFSFSKDKFGGFDVSAYGVSPVIQYHPIKQSAEVPVSVGFSVGVQKYFFSSKDLDAADASLSLFDIGGSVSVYRFFKLTSNIGVIPAASFGVTHSFLTTTVAGQDMSDDSTGEALAFGAYLAYIDDAGRIWGLVPSVSVGFGGDSTVTSFGLEFGLIISQQ